MASPLDAAAAAAAATLERLAIRNVVTVWVGPLRINYDGWESIRIQRGMDQLAGNFSLSFVDKWRQTFQNWSLVPGQEILVTIGTEPVIRGYIDSLNVSVKNDSRTMEVVGRDRTGDLVDSSISATAPAEYKLMTIAQLANIFVTIPFQIPVTFDTDIGLPFSKFTVKQGESPFELLQRAAELRGLLIQSTELGTLNITNRFSPASLFRSPTPLVQGGNILEMSATYDDTERFQTYVVKGQSSGTDLLNRKLVGQVFGAATDPGILRPGRQKTIIADGSVDLATAQRRAEWEANIRAAKGAEVMVKVQGWRMDPLGLGPLWRPNTLVTINAPFVGQQAGEMLIRSVQFSKSVPEGTTTTLDLVRPDAYMPAAVVNPLLDSSKNLGWQFQVLKILGN